MSNETRSRRLSPEFMHDLMLGILAPLLEWVKADPTLDLQIRDGYINIYYRGGNLLKVEQKGAHYVPTFSQVGKSGQKGYSQHLAKLLAKTGCPLKIPAPWKKPFRQVKDVQAWLSIQLPVCKLMMDVSKQIKVERDVQQRIVQVNNRGGLANGTDWYIGDLEFAVPVQKLGAARRSVIRVDMLALHWPSTGSERKSPDQLEWALVELKTGNKAINGTAGLDKHLADMSAMRREANWLEEMREQVRDAVNQRFELKLIDGLKHAVNSISTKPPLLVFVLADIDPATSQLGAWLGRLAKEPKEVQDSVRFFVAHLMGYALHDNGLLTLDEIRRYVSQCWKKV